MCLHLELELCVAHALRVTQEMNQSAMVYRASITVLDQTTKFNSPPKFLYSIYFLKIPPPPPPHTHAHKWLVFFLLQISTNVQIMSHFVDKYVLMLMVVISVLVWMDLSWLRTLTSAEVTDCSYLHHCVILIL